MATRYVRCERCRKPMSKDSAHYIPKENSLLLSILVALKITDEDEMVCKECKDTIIKECEADK